MRVSVEDDFETWLKNLTGVQLCGFYATLLGLAFGTGVLSVEVVTWLTHS
jgi:hypothetical protein